MSVGFNESYFDCIENSDNVNIFQSCDTYIGYGTKGGVYAIRTLSIISLILNFLFLIFQFIKIRRKKKENRRKTTMRSLFQILPLFDCILSIYWIISSFHFSQASDIRNHIGFCTFLSVFYQVCFTFQFIMINCILIYFKRINLSPMEGILKPHRNILKYTLISLLISLIVGIFSIFFNIGRSGMNTCFINTIKAEWYSLFFFIPIAFIFVAVGQIILDLCCKDVFITDRKIRLLYKKNSYYVLIFCFLHLPLIIFFLHVSIAGKDITDMNETSYQIYSSIITIFTSMIPLIIGLIRYFQGLMRIDCINDIIKHNRITKARMTKSLEKNQSIKMENSVALIESDPFDWLDKHIMECFMRDILIGIASGLKRSKKYGNKIILNDGGNSMEFEKYTINFGALRSLKLGDETINKSDYLNIKIINYAPKSFAYLRQLENIDIDEMIESFLPKNNTQGLKKSQGKSGSFFISTDDNKYMVKSLKSDEIDLIRNGFLSKYIKHIERTNNESLLCRLYGMFNIMMAQGQEFLVIVMRNVIGDFKENTVVKFDLKGSTYKRKANFDMDSTNTNVMKDLNFDELERNIMINNNSINKLRDIVKQDSKFLCRSELMDYSLFLVKLTLNKEEAIDIFGDDIIEEQNKAVQQLFNKSNNKSQNSINNSQNENIGNEEKDKIDQENENIKINEMVGKKRGKGNIKDIKHYEQYLFPSLREGGGYIISIIDYFQYFNFFKVIEANIISKFKTGFNKEKNKTVSCVNPQYYSERFIKYFIQLTDISKIKEINDNNELEKIDEEDENNIDNEKEENKKDEESEVVDILGNLPNLYEDKINVDLKEKEDDDINFNLNITIMNKKLANRDSFLKKANTNFKLKKKPV